MSEAEILSEILLLTERTNQLTQWWASMSLGLIVVAHFARKDLNVFLVGLLLLVYISFSVNMATQFVDAGRPIAAFRADLAALQATGTTSQGTDAVLAPLFRFWDVVTYPISFLGLFFGSIFYLLYSYLQARKEARS